MSSRGCLDQQRLETSVYSGGGFVGQAWIRQVPAQVVSDLWTGENASNVWKDKKFSRRTR